MSRARVSAIVAVGLLGPLATFALGCAAPQTGATGTPGDTPAAPTDSAEPGSASDGQPAGFSIASTAFADGSAMPVEHCRTTIAGGENLSPPLAWSGAPDRTASYVITMIDLHPIASRWVHWVVTDIPPTATGLAAGASGSGMPPGARELDNTFSDQGYGGPSPPAGTGVHEYELTVYALDVPSLDLPAQPSADQIGDALAGHVLARASLVGTFSR